jgi:hypothetical protein
VSGALFLHSSVLASDFTKIFFPLVTNLSTFGYSTQTISQTLCKACTTHVTVVGVNLCHQGPLRVNGKGIRGVGRVSDKETYTVHITNVISPQRYFVAHCLISYVGNVFGLHSMCICFPSTHKLVM